MATPSQTVETAQSPVHNLSPRLKSSTVFQAVPPSEWHACHACKAPAPLIPRSI